MCQIKPQLGGGTKTEISGEDGNICPLIMDVWFWVSDFFSHKGITLLGSVSAADTTQQRVEGWRGLNSTRAKGTSVNLQQAANNG